MDKMDTKHRILDEALTLFSQKGYANVYVGEIAERVGIKAPSLYKHYKNKQAIFDAIVEEMNNRYTLQAAALQIGGVDPNADASVYSNKSEDNIVEIGKKLFLYFLHDEYTSKFRKILTIEQFHNADFAKIYSSQYIDGPLSYQKMLFGAMAAAGDFRPNDADIMAIQFYSPIYMLLTLCDREPDKENEALELLDKHFRQFAFLYGGTNK